MFSNVIVVILLSTFYFGVASAGLPETQPGKIFFFLGILKKNRCDDYIEENIQKLNNK